MYVSVHLHSHSTFPTEKRDLGSRLRWTKVVNVAPQLLRKPQKLRQEPAQHSIDPSKPVDDVYVCPIPGNDQLCHDIQVLSSLSMCGLQFSTCKAEKLTE